MARIGVPVHHLPSGPAMTGWPSMVCCPSPCCSCAHVTAATITREDAARRISAWRRRRCAPSWRNWPARRCKFRTRQAELPTHPLDTFSPGCDGRPARTGHRAGRLGRTRPMPLPQRASRRAGHAGARSRCQEWRVSPAARRADGSAERGTHGKTSPDTGHRRRLGPRRHRRLHQSPALDRPG